jgi:hypothetical protein
MRLFRKIKEIIDPINRMTPAQIIQSIPLVWARVPICIFAGYYGNKHTEENIVDHDLIVSSIALTDVQVYGRDIETVCDGEPYKLAVFLYSSMKDGTEKEKLGDATHSLLLGELEKGGTNISQTLAIKSGGLGYTTISKPIIEKLMSVDYPTSADVIEKTTKEALEKIWCLT